jgi:hypothetical protein
LQKKLKQLSFSCFLKPVCLFHLSLYKTMEEKKWPYSTPSQTGLIWPKSTNRLEFFFFPTPQSRETGIQIPTKLASFSPNNTNSGRVWHRLAFRPLQCQLKKQGIPSRLQHLRVVEYLSVERVSCIRILRTKEGVGVGAGCLDQAGGAVTGIGFLLDMPGSGGDAKK